MKFVNLDKFSSATEVSLKGKTYTVNGITVGDYIDKNYDQMLEKAKTTKDAAKAMVQILGELSDIPEAVLKSLGMKELQILIQISQGVDFSDEAQAKEGDSGNAQ